MTGQDLPRGTPMCERWYERAGNYRPWHRDVPGCICGVTAHHPPEQHGTNCPVYHQYWSRQEMPGKLTAGEPER